MKTKLLTLLTFLSVNYASSGQTFIQRYADIANQVSQTNITNSLTQFEGLGVKYRNTAALENTYQWLVNKYTSFGYSAAQITADTYTYSGSTCKNLVVTKVGTLYPNTYVIVCGHYDSINGTGTNDNGSGVASILEVARLLQNVNTEYSIKFINFSGEEDGLKGSQHFVSAVVNGTTPKMDIRLVFNLDEVGGVAGMTNNTITCEKDTNGTPTTNNAASATMTNQLITCVGLYSPLQTFLSNAYASDYMPFEDNNEIITGFFEKNETSHKHTATDLLVNMDPVYNYKVAKAATGAVLHFAKAETVLSNDGHEFDYQVSFYPNPTKDRLNINLGSLNVSQYDLLITDINGKTALKSTFNNPKLIEAIDIQGLSKGMYLVALSSGDKKVTKKIVIQ
ncbi:M20/M25/M40 family metallo-hydrolase [Flavobacterium amniphilum]|uniref:M20/M25/M40 family metallo-hydrolase n=1 Tax=Flavobacterium amniphilum TaxID=1834035 RepID=UPI00202A52B5|nr:M20/M25/M40 family metallo-hydrolase [Flavobacterium amniphilum]MCL9807281.1 M20/M25/M40 family metallo-hydrolase [Flavobacterium amniphilum]